MLLSFSPARVLSRAPVLRRCAAVPRRSPASHKGAFQDEDVGAVKGPASCRVGDWEEGRCDDARHVRPAAAVAAAGTLLLLLLLLLPSATLLVQTSRLCLARLTCCCVADWLAGWRVRDVMGWDGMIKSGWTQRRICMYKHARPRVYWLRKARALGGRVRVCPEMSPAGVCLPACSNLFVQRDEGEGEGEGGVVCCQHQLHRRQAARDGCNLWWWRVTANQ